MAENLLSEGVVKQISDINQSLSELCDKLEQTSDAFSDTMTKTFSSFKDIIADGKFWENMSGGVSKLQKELTGLQKGAMVTTAAFSEFDIISEAFEGLASGSEDVSGEIGKISVAATVAGTAMYAALGPAGIAVAAISGVIGAINGIGDAFAEIQAEASAKAIGDALSNPGGIPIEVLTDSYTDMIERIGAGFEMLSEKVKELENTCNQIQRAYESIEVISFAMENGATVTEDTIAKLDALFLQLLHESESKFDQEYDIIMMGLAGSFGDALNAAGIATEEYIAILEQYKSSNEQAYDDLLEKQKELQDQLEKGQITQDEYAKSLSDSIDQYAATIGSVDEYADSIDSLNASVEEINFGLLIDEGNQFNADRMRLQFSSLAEESQNARNMIETSSEGILEVLQSMLQWAEEQGDAELMDKISTAISAEEEAVRTATGEVDTALIEYSEMLQNSLLEDIPNVIDQALQEREGKGWLYKLTHSETDDVEAALEKYQTDVLDVADEELKKMYADSGIELSAYVSDQGAEIIDSFMNATDDEHMAFYAGNIREGWRDTLNGYIDEATAEIVIHGQNSGGEIVQSVSEGAESEVPVMAEELEDSLTQELGDSLDNVANSMNGSAEEIGQNIGWGIARGLGVSQSGITAKTNEIVQSIINQTKGGLKIQSPSRVMFELGSYTMEGFKAGIENLYQPIMASIGDFSYELQNVPVGNLESIYENTYVPQYSIAEYPENYRQEIETNALLRELLSVVREGKIIELNGREIGKEIQKEDISYFRRTGKGMFQH